jgi:hypothetical protein
MIAMTSHWAPTLLGPLRILGWQWILVWTGLPAFLLALLFLTLREPQRLPRHADAGVPRHGSLLRRALTFTGLDAAKAIRANRRVYYPLFIGLALSALESFGLAFWRVPFLIRTYGWTEAQIGTVTSLTVLVSSLLGLLVGGTFVEWLAKRHKDANVRAAFICFAVVTVCSILSPLMPTAMSSILVMGWAPCSALPGPSRKMPRSSAWRPMRCADRSQRSICSCSPFSARWAASSSGGRAICGGGPGQIVDRAGDHRGHPAAAGHAVHVPAIRPYREEIERLEALEQ